MKMKMKMKMMITTTSFSDEDNDDDNDNDDNDDDDDDDNDDNYDNDDACLPCFQAPHENPLMCPVYVRFLCLDPMCTHDLLAWPPHAPNTDVKHKHVSKFACVSCCCTRQNINMLCESISWHKTQIL